ncbi:MAG: hypothetical protein AAB116_12455, partial [Candidatus Poribacteria bacterium]
VIFFEPREHGFKFDTIFERSASGTHPNVNTSRLKAIWKPVSHMIDGHGPGVIHAYPRDADNIAVTLSELSGKNFVSLSSLSPIERDTVTKAFQKRTPYKGRSVDAIVGKIREGLDFPDAGWYLSFKKYVRYPETIQGQGRVVRLNLDKPTPVIIYFGENMKSVAFNDVRELVLGKIGLLPRKMANGRGFQWARNPQNTHPGSKLGETMSELNVAMEAVFRRHPELSKQFGDTADPNPEIVSALQDTVLSNRSSQENREIAQAVKQLIYQINSFSFYKGTLSETWKYCDKLLRAFNGGKPYSNRLSNDDLAILQNHRQMEMIKEFRAMKSWIGPIPRAVLEDIQLQPNGVYEMAETVNAFVARYGKPPEQVGGESSLFIRNLKDTMSVSSETLYSRLNHISKVTLEPMFMNNSSISFEKSITDHFGRTGRLPDFIFEKLGQGTELTLADKVDHRLAQRLQAYIQTGSLDTSNLSPEFLKVLDQSEFFTHPILDISKAIADSTEGLSLTAGNKQQLAKEMTFNRLMLHEEFGALKTLDSLAKQGLPNSIKYKKFIEDLLQRHFQ